ncbi:hypothetical protein V493_01755 [Pseudogymnoascus sp. VKM F-4281 (FW-2241)]|nr:hypothetical protein V493_01755 [Pseudogymnoascus sp. VKM F-4281 (FW-2241)]
MARKVNIKSEDFDQGDESYKSKASSPTTPKRVTRSSAKRPSDVAKLSERPAQSSKKQKNALKPAFVRGEVIVIDDSGDTTGGSESDESNGTIDDEKLVKQQLACIQREQQQKADIALHKLHLKQRENNRRRERECLERMKKHREEQARLEQKGLEEEQQRKQKDELLEKGRLEKEKQRLLKVRQQQDKIDTFNLVKERIDRELLEKQRKETKGKCDRQLAEERPTKSQEGVDVAKMLRQEEENESDGDEEDESSGEDEDENSGDDESKREVPKAVVGNIKPKDIEDEETSKNEDENENEGEGKEEKDGKNPLLGTESPDLASRPVEEEPYACIRCIKHLAISPIYLCNFTDNPDKCTRCSNRGRNCVPVPDFAHSAACKVLALQKQHDAADPGSREALRLRVQVGAREVAELVLGAEARRRKSRDNTYRAILFGQVAMKHNQEEILKLLRSLLPRRSGEVAGSVVSGRVNKKKRRV